MGLSIFTRKVPVATYMPRQRVSASSEQDIALYIAPSSSRLCRHPQYVVMSVWLKNGSCLLFLIFLNFSS